MEDIVCMLHEVLRITILVWVMCPRQTKVRLSNILLSCIRGDPKDFIEVLDMANRL
jgi:hypothetical protein